jgi:hypothetical protein
MPITCEYSHFACNANRDGREQVITHKNLKFYLSDTEKTMPKT